MARFAFHDEQDLGQDEPAIDPAKQVRTRSELRASGLELPPCLEQRRHIINRLPGNARLSGALGVHRKRVRPLGAASPVAKSPAFRITRPLS